MSWVSQGGKAFRVAAGIAVSAAAVSWFVRDATEQKSVECTEKADAENDQKKVTFHPQLSKVLASWTTNFKPSVQWDHNWDRRDPKSLVKPSKIKEQNSNSNNDFENEVKKATPSASRHLFLIRHGQYNTEGDIDSKRFLTELGFEQADITGQRLSAINKNYTNMIHSTMMRAKETANQIHKHLPDVPVSQCDLLREGAPYPPEPPVGHWRPEEQQFYQDGARIEAAFRKYFHRAEAEQKTDSFQVIVCHANVIRYCVCRALQIPPEAWLRMSLAHGSITHVIIRPSGRVVLRNLGDSGHMPVEKVTLS